MCRLNLFDSEGSASGDLKLRQPVLQTDSQPLCILLYRQGIAAANKVVSRMGLTAQTDWDQLLQQSESLAARVGF